MSDKLIFLAAVLVLFGATAGCASIASCHSYQDPACHRWRMYRFDSHGDPHDATPGQNR